MNKTRYYQHNSMRPKLASSVPTYVPAPHKSILRKPRNIYSKHSSIVQKNSNALSGSWQNILLRQEERQLFEDFLLQEIAEAIRTHILEAEEWVQQVNGVLKGLPMIGEHYALQWKPPAEYDLTKLGSHLAQHYKLLRKPA